MAWILCYTNSIKVTQRKIYQLCDIELAFCDIFWGGARVKLNTHYTTEAQRASAAGWRENDLGPSLYYAYRDTTYDRAGYPSTVHYHDYFELVVFVEGDIRYICEDESYRPLAGDIILIPPGKLHMSMLEGEATRYRRHVFYLYPDAFAAMGGGGLTTFLASPGGVQLALPPSEREGLLDLLTRLDRALAAEGAREHALGLALAMEAFYRFGEARPCARAGEDYLPESVAAIRRHIDAHFCELDSVAEVAEQLYYTREHVARLFRQYFNTTVSDYIRTRRVAYARTLIDEGVPLSEACFRAGFGNMSTFIRAFRAVTGMTPSAFQRTK